MTELPFFVCNYQNGIYPEDTLKIGDRYHKQINTKTIPRVYKIINSALRGKYQQIKLYRESDKQQYENSYKLRREEGETIS